MIFMSLTRTMLESDMVNPDEYITPLDLLGCKLENQEERYHIDIFFFVFVSVFVFSFESEREKKRPDVI